MNILVTGADGFIGKHLIKALRGKGHTIYGGTTRLYLCPHRGDLTYVTCDLNRESNVESMLDLIRPDYIFHLAGVSDPGACDNSLFENITTTNNLIKYAGQAKDTKFIFASSVLVYGSGGNKKGETDPLTPTNYYGVTKAACEHILNIHAQDKETPIDIKIVRLGNVVGAGMTRGVVYDWWKKSRIKRFKSDDILELPIHEYPLFNHSASRPFIHVSDAVNALIKSAFETPYKQPFIVNACPQDSITIRQAVDIVMEDFKYPFSILNKSPEFPPDEIECFSNAGFYGFGAKLNSAEAVRQAVRDLNENNSN